MKCINCGYFGDCEEADYSKTECYKYIRVKRNITKLDKKEGEICNISRLDEN